MADRITQIVLETLEQTDHNSNLSQIVLEAVQRIPHAARVSQIVLEVLVKQNTGRFTYAYGPQRRLNRSSRT